MKRVFLAIGAVIVLQSLAVNAQTFEKKFRIRYGFIITSEISTKKISIKNESEMVNKVTFDNFKARNRFNGIAYASISLQLDKGRDISIYDYSLEGMRGGNYRCVAIRKSGDNDYDASKWEIRNADPDAVYTLLFVVEPPSDFEQKKEYKLKFKLDDKPVYKIAFIDKKNRKLTDPQVIKDSLDKAKKEKEKKESTDKTVPASVKN